MADISVRQATVSDIHLIETVLRDAVNWLTAIGQPLWGADEVAWASLSKNFEPDDFYIAFRDGVLSGCMALVEYDPFFWPNIKRGESLFLHKLAVTRAARKTGVADSLMDFFCAQAAERGIKTLRLDTHALRPKLHAFYKSHGFEIVDTRILGNGFHTAFLEKHLPETDDEKRARIYPIILSDYNPDWPEWYANEKAALERLIDSAGIFRISHFGSTSVPGLMAKPTIDILIEISDTADVQSIISSLSVPDYIYLKDESNPTIAYPPLHLMFIKGYLPDGFAEKVFHIHIVRRGHWNERLRFKDYLIAHPEAAAEYAALKRSLLQNYEHDRDGYTDAKGAFIRSILDKLQP